MRTARKSRFPTHSSFIAESCRFQPVLSFTLVDATCNNVCERETCIGQTPMTNRAILFSALGRDIRADMYNWRTMQQRQISLWVASGGSASSTEMAVVLSRCRLQQFLTLRTNLRHCIQFTPCFSINRLLAVTFPFLCGRVRCACMYRLIGLRM